jgi:hypothetical protein
MTLESGLRGTVHSRAFIRALYARKHARPKHGGGIAAWLAHIYDLILGREPGPK